MGAVFDRRARGLLSLCLLNLACASQAADAGGASDQPSIGPEYSVVATSLVPASRPGDYEIRAGLVSSAAETPATGYSLKHAGLVGKAGTTTCAAVSNSIFGDGYE